MKRATVVIGANYGDEGKGKLVDFIASGITEPKVVVRFNGGAQAGHTVVAEGKRHVFSHFGSGTLAGAKTYLAKHFVCNPIMFWHELRQLHDLTIRPEVGVDPRCLITTPYDMIINQLVEDARGGGRHGSVGVGFGETIERSNHPSFRLQRSDLPDRDLVKRRLRLVRDEWLPARLRRLNVPALPKSDARLRDDLIDKAAESFIAFSEVTAIAGAEFLDQHAVIFEGAQGLCLDMDGPNFPHVTRSNTGLANVVPLARACALTLDVIYATRPYLTKHGAGPMPGEYVPDPPIIDETNTDHPYQGKFRYAALDASAMRARVEADLKIGGHLISGWSYGATCLDHAGGEAALSRLMKEVGPVRFYSTSPERSGTAEIVK